jgi:hypothetical protein
MHTMVLPYASKVFVWAENLPKTRFSAVSILLHGGAPKWAQTQIPAIYISCDNGGLCLNVGNVDFEGHELGLDVAVFDNTSKNPAQGTNHSNEV